MPPAELLYLHGHIAFNLPAPDLLNLRERASAARRHKMSCPDFLQALFLSRIFHSSLHNYDLGSIFVLEIEGSNGKAFQIFILVHLCHNLRIQVNTRENYQQIFTCWYWTTIIHMYLFPRCIWHFDLLKRCWWSWLPNSLTC